MRGSHYTDTSGWGKKAPGKDGLSSARLGTTRTAGHRKPKLPLFMSTTTWPSSILESTTTETRIIAVSLWPRITPFADRKPPWEKVLSALSFSQYDGPLAATARRFTKLSESAVSDRGITSTLTSTVTVPSSTLKL